MNTGLNIDALKHYFESRRDVAFAFLFGSEAKGTAISLSDIDIAVYFYPAKRHPIEYEEEVFYDGEGALWGDLEKLLKGEVELLVLNRVSATVAASAIRGKPLAVNHWGLYLDFMEVVTEVAEDYREMIFRDFLERMKLERRAKAEITEAHEFSKG